jgi:hypothetical protein
VLSPVQRGKSNLLQVLITQLALRYPPEELELYLIDFKQVEFDYLLRARLPHARVVASEADREYGVSALRLFQEEIDRRARLFKQAAVPHLRAYRSVTGERLPRSLVVMDEFQALFLRRDQHADAAGTLLGDIARRGAAFGLHLLMATQSPSAGETPTYLRPMYEQMGLRIALGCRHPGVSYAILGDGNDGATRLRKPGEAIYDDHGGATTANPVVRIAELPFTERTRWTATISALAGDRRYPPPASFDPSSPAYLTDNPRCTELLSCDTWPPAAEIVDAWLGDPVEIKAPTSARFERDIRSNLLVVGAEQTGYRVLGATLLSVGLQLAPADVAFDVIDCARTTSSFKGYLTRLAHRLPHQIRITGPRGGAGVVDDVVALLDERSEHPDTTGPSRFLLIAGLHRWQDLEGEFGRRTPVGDRLARLADEGPECGIHLVVSVESAGGLERTLGRDGVKLFYLRTMTRISEPDSLALLGTPAAARLEDNCTRRRGRSTIVFRALGQQHVQRGDIVRHRDLDNAVEIARRRPLQLHQALGHERHVSRHCLPAVTAR